MRYEVVIRPEAERDLAEIYDLIADDNPIAALRFVEGIRELAMSLSDLPFRGKSWEDPVSGIRTLVFRKRAVIAYRVLGGRVDVTRVIYAGRDYEAVLRRNKPR